MKVGGLGGGGDGAEVLVGGEGLGAGGPGGVPGVGEVDLIDVARGDVGFGGADGAGEGFAGGLGGEVEGWGRAQGLGNGWEMRAGGVPTEAGAEVAGFVPGGGVVDIHQGVGIVAEGEVAVVTDPAVEAGGGEGPVGIVGLGVALEEGFDTVPVVVDAAGEDFLGVGGEQGEGAGARLGAVEPDETGAMGEQVGEVLGRGLPGALFEGGGRGGDSRCWAAARRWGEAGPLKH